jgi:ParB/RepB/Spo0J family partition protein
MTTPKKAVPPKFSGLLKQGIIEAAPESAVNGMPSFANLPTAIESSVHLAAGTDEGEDQVPIGSASASQTELVTLIAIDRIDASRFQNRLTLSEEKIASLAENIRQDGLNNPIIVRTVGARYELVAGETRMRAFQHLGYQEIPAFVRDMDDAHSARSTVLDNFFHETLTDYEIYKGLQTLMDVNAATSIRKLADITPWEKSHVQRLMAFGRLTPSVIDMLEQQPNLIGCATAESLAACKGKGVDVALVVKAVERIRDGKMPQTRAMAWIESKGMERSVEASTPVRAVVTSAQGNPLCTVDRGPKGIKIQAAQGITIDWEPIQTALIGLLKGQLSNDANVNG